MIFLLNSLPSRFNALKETFRYNKYTFPLEDMTSDARYKDKVLKISRVSHDDGEGYYARGRSEKKILGEIIRLILN